MSDEKMSAGMSQWHAVHEPEASWIAPWAVAKTQDGEVLEYAREDWSHTNIQGPVRRFASDAAARRFIDEELI